MIDQNSDDKVVPFSPDSGGAHELKPDTAPPAVETPPAVAPWDVLAESLAAEAYRIAHGLVDFSDMGSGPHKGRMAQIQSMLAKELKTGTEAVLAWAGCSLYFHSMQHALRHVVLGAEVHGPSKGRHNERVLVYSDRLTALADLVQKEPKTHEGAATWWKEREARLLVLEDLPRVIASVERQMGGTPPEAKDHDDVQRVEGMLMGLLGVVAQQKQIMERQEKRNKDLLEANEKLLRRLGGAR